MKNTPSLSLSLPLTLSPSLPLSLSSVVMNDQSYGRIKTNVPVKTLFTANCRDVGSSKLTNLLFHHNVNCATLTAYWIRIGVDMAKSAFKWPTAELQLIANGHFLAFSST
jgi:hypothetical protein